VTKKEQARLFNERVGQVKFLVATDAVGMGLNFNIQRVIFFTISKWMDKRQIMLQQAELKQIAGRAGRYQEDGYVTAFNEKNLSVIRQMLGDDRKSLENGPLSHLLERPFKKAAIFPPFQLIESAVDDLYINQGIKLSLHQIFSAFHTILGGDIDSQYFLRDVTELINIAKILANI